MRVVHVALSLHSLSFTDICNFRKKNMKKLALAPAMTLAITRLASSPVIAASDASAPAPSADTQPATQPGALQKMDAQNADAQDGEIPVSADKVSVEDFAENGVGIAATVL